MKNFLNEFYKRAKNNNLFVISSAIVISIVSFFIFLIALAWGQVFITDSEDITNQNETIAIVNNQTFFLEVADSEEERRRGLMFRTDLGENEGMLFIFDNEEPRTFWMKDTPLSLDIIYLNSNKEVVSLHERALPNQTETVYPSEFPAEYVVELRGGTVQKYGIEVGDKFNID